MLKTTKTINLNGESRIGDSVIVMLSASISSISNTTINKTIVRQDLYQTNKEVVIADMDAFETEVMTLIDSFSSEQITV